MKKYIRLACDTCKRTTDKLINLTHYATDKCVITLGCEGRLHPLSYTAAGAITTAPEAGVTDWRARGTSVTTYATAEEVEFVNLSTGSTGQLVVAAPVDQATYALNLSIQADTPKSYRSYVFRSEATVTTVSGVESGLEKKTLRFTAYGTTPDIVEVLVNGVRMEKGTAFDQFQVYDGTSSSAIPPNTISFNTPITTSGTTQIDVIVSKESTSTATTLTFTRNVYDSSRVGTGAWENVDYVDHVTLGRLYLYRIDLDEISIAVNSILIPETDSAVFLLARQPFSQLDRYTSIILPISGFSIERDYLKYHVIDGSIVMQVTKTSLSNTYPPITLTKFATETTIKTALAGVTEQLIIDGAVITGPDA